MREYDDITLKKVQEAEMQILKTFMNICDKHNLTYFGLAGTGIGALRHQGFIPWDDDIDIALPRKDYELFLTYANQELSDEYTVMNCEYDENYPLMTTRLMLKGTKFREEALQNIDCEFGIFLDIYPMDNMSDDPKLFKKQTQTAWFYSKLLILRSIPFPVLGFTGWKKTLVHAICCCVHYAMCILHISKKYLYKKCKEACCRYNDVETSRINYPCDTSAVSCMLHVKEVYPLVTYPFEDVELNFPKDLDSSLKRMYGNYMELPPVEKRKNHFPFELEFKK